MTKTQSNYAANDRQPATGVFLALVENTAPKSLKRLVEEAVLAAEIRSTLLRGDGNEYAIDAAEEAANATRQALLDHLLFEHGVGGSLASRIGEVL